MGKDGKVGGHRRGLGRRDGNRPQHQERGFLFEPGTKEPCDGGLNYLTERLSLPFLRLDHSMDQREIKRNDLAGHRHGSFQ